MIKNSLGIKCRMRKIVYFREWVLGEGELVEPSSSSRGNVTDRPAKLFTGCKSNPSLNMVLEFVVI